MEARPLHINEISLTTPLRQMLRFEVKRELGPGSAPVENTLLLAARTFRQLWRCLGHLFKKFRYETSSIYLYLQAPADFGSFENSKQTMSAPVV